MTKLLIKYGNIVLTTTTGHLTLYHLWLILIVRLGGYITNLLDFCSYSLIGKLTVFFTVSGVQLAQTNRGVFHYHRTTFSSMLKNKVDLTLTKASVLRITLNLDGVPIISKSHTHPSHSQTSRLLTSSLSLGIPVPRSTQCMWGMYVDLSSLGFSLSSYRQSYIGFVFNSRFID